MKQMLSLLILLGLASLTSAQSDTWTQGTSLSSPRAALGAGTVDGRIYVIGGAKNAVSPLATVESYDPATDTWSPKADMPTPRAGMAVCEMGGQIYAIGGTIGMANKTAVEVYDPVTDTTLGLKRQVYLWRGGRSPHVLWPGRSIFSEAHPG